MKRKWRAVLVALLTGCANSISENCTPLDFGVPDSIATVDAKFCTEFNTPTLPGHD